MNQFQILRLQHAISLASVINHKDRLLAVLPTPLDLYTNLSHHRIHALTSVILLSHFQSLSVLMLHHQIPFFSTPFQLGPEFVSAPQVVFTLAQ